mgnify:FL=1
MSKFSAPKGVKEYLPPDSSKFEFVRDGLLFPARMAGYQLVELPVFEDTEVFTRGVGASTDVVTKEMYTFDDRGGRSITLRPEGTAGAIRAVIEHGLDKGQLPVKIFYQGAFFRAERPQAGRYRQFYQVGIEAIGFNDPEIDVEVIAVADQGYKKLGLSKYKLEITSLGDLKSRTEHRKDLMKFIEKLKLDEATLERAKLNPLRLFDDKRDEIKKLMQEAPVLIDYLSNESQSHFSKVQGLLKQLKIDFVINPRMVRGLDYYTGTTFEFVHPLLGAQSGIGGGGRYDGLMSELGGSEMSGIGFGLGIDRTVLALEAENVAVTTGDQIQIYFVALGESAKSLVYETMMQLRKSGVRSDMAYGDRGLKGAMNSADKRGVRFVAVVGENEIKTKQIEVKNMNEGKSTLVTLAAKDLIDFVKQN